MNRSTFWEALRESQLLPDSKIAEVSARYACDEPVGNVTERLVSDGVLTRLQVQRLAAGDVRSLVLGQYRLLEELGRGGMGCVYKAVHTVMERTVAIKLLAPKIVEDPHARGWFKREVRACTQLIHPNIVMAYDANEADGRLFLVMEYVDGPNLEHLVQQRGPLAAGVASELLRQTALALQAAHDKGIVHRDIKPANLLIPRGGIVAAPHADPGNDSGPQPLVKIADFGLARLQRSAGHSTVTSRESGFLGTPDYVAPEQAKDISSADIRSDLYSLGCTFYFALAGRAPFGGETVFEKVSRHLADEAVPLSQVRSDVSPALAGVIRRLMAKDPARRFQTPNELLAELVFLGGAVPRRRSGFWAALGRPSLALDKAGDGKTEMDSPGDPNAALPADSTAITCFTPVRVITPGETPVPRSGPTPPPITTPVALDDAVLPLAGRDEPDAPIAADPALRKTWSAWTEVVEALAGGRTSRHVDGEGYRALHLGLLARCRALLTTASGRTRALYQTIHDLVEPWLTPDALASVDAEALQRLLARCREADRWLGIRRKKWFTLRRAALVFWMLVFASGAAAAGLWALDQPGVGLFGFRYWLRAAWRQVESNPLIWTALALPVVLTAAVTAFTRPPRS